MLVNKNGHLQSSLHPNKNWTDDDSYYVIDETKEENKELIQKIKEHSPYMELIVEDGELVDIIPTERPPELEPPKPELTEEQKKIAQLEKDKEITMKALIELHTKLLALESEK